MTDAEFPKLLRGSDEERDHYIRDRLFDTARRNAECLDRAIASLEQLRERDKDHG